MEKFDHKEYRDELAHKLKEIRKSDPENIEKAQAKAQGYLEAQKETEEYKEAEKAHHKEIQKKIEEAEREAKWEYMKEHLREDLLSALENKEEKEKLQEFFNVLDELIEKGIYFREGRIARSWDMRPFGDMSPDDYPSFPKEMKREYANLDIILRDIVSLGEKYRDLKRRILEIFKNNQRKKLEEIIPYLSLDSDDLFNNYDVGGDINKFMPGFILGTRKIIHTDELSYGYRASEERIGKFKAFVESFQRTPEEIEKFDKEKLALEQEIEKVRGEYNKAEEETDKILGEINGRLYDLRDKYKPYNLEK